MNVSVAPVNDAPTVVGSSLVLDAVEDTNYPLSNARLKEISQAADIDLNVLSFRITEISQGQLKRPDGSLFSAGETVGPTEAILWVPPLNAFGAEIPAFKVRAFDGVELSLTETKVSFKVAAVNDAPTLNTIATFTGAVEGNKYQIKFSDLLAKSDMQDVDNTNLRFRLVSLIGDNPASVYAEGSSTPLTAGSVLASGETWEWTPQSKFYSREVQAFEVEAWDGTAASVNKIAVNFDVLAVNQPQTFRIQARNAGAIPVVAGSDYEITYEKIANDLELADSENSSSVPAESRAAKPVIVIESVDFGTLRKEAENVVNGTTTIEPSQSWMWTAPTDRLGNVDALVVRAKDAAGTYSRSVATYVFDVQPRPNTAPAFTSVTTVQGATEDVPYILTYEELKGLSDATDADNNSILFRVRELKSGALKKGSVLLTPAMLADPGVLVGPGDVLTWQANQNDFDLERLGFTLSATDSLDDSAVVSGVLDTQRYVGVKFNVAPVNDAPAFSAVATLSQNAMGDALTEDVPASLSFAQLYFASTLSDVDDEVLATPDPDKSFNHRFVVRSLLPGSTLEVDGVALSVGDEITKAASTIVWTPPLHAYGNLTAFSLRLRDENALGSQESSSDIPVVMTVLPVNDAPVVAIPAGEPASNYRLSGAQEDIIYVLTYDAIKEKLTVANNYISDIDGPQLEFMVAPVADSSGSATFGTLTKGGVQVVLGDSVRFQPGESLVWQPPLYTNGVLAPFSVRAYDGTLQSTDAALMELFVQPVNHPPAIAENKTVTAQKNTALPIAHWVLAQLLELSDVENVMHAGDSATSCPVAPNVTFKIVDVPGGSITKLNTSGDAVALAPGGLIAPCEKLVWQPPLDGLGTYPGVRVRAVDDQGLMSSMTGLITFDVQGSNAAPYFSGNTPATLLNGKQDLPYTVTYDALLAATGAIDPENDTIRFEVTAGLGGSATFKGSNQIGETPLLVGPGETIIWNPVPAVKGVQQAFAVRAFDGDKFSADDPGTGRQGQVIVTIDLARVNRAPSIVTTPVLPGTNDAVASEDSPYVITVGMLQAATSATDPDLNETIRFKVDETFTNAGVLEYEVTPGTWQNVSAGQGDIIGDGYTTEWRWTPPLHTYGPIQAFAIRAFDGDNATGLSAVAAPVTINVVHVNHAPVLGSLVGGNRVIATLNNALEDEAYLIRYDALFNAGVPTDVDGDTLRFKYVSTTTGTLFRNGNPVAPGALLLPGETWTWQPALNANGTLVAFRIVVNDGLADSPVDLPVSVNVAAINDVPTFGPSSQLNNASKNQAGGYVITFADIASKIPVNDVETDQNQIQYRIESVGSGTLRMGNSQTGNDVASLVNKPFLRASGGDGVTADSQLNWTPPLNAVGNFTLMTLRAYDGTDFTVQPIEVKIDVLGSNAVPTINTGFTLGSSSVPEDGTYQNVPKVIGYETLLQKSQAADTDLTTVYLQITYLETGTLKVNGQTYSAVGVIDPPLKIGPGEKLTWRPDQEARGVDAASLSAFRIQAYDNIDASTNESLVKVNVSPVNQAPMIAGSFNYPDAARNFEYPITFNSLAESLQISDVEDIDPTLDVATSPNKYGKMKFRVEEILGGQYLKIGANTGSASPYNAASNNIVQPGNAIFWKPPANGTGTFDGFRV